MLRVVSVEPAGHVATWNGARPLRAVEPGDWILEVNGKAGPPLRVVQELRSPHLLLITVAREQRPTQLQRTPAGSLVPASRWGLTKVQAAEFARECRATCRWDPRDDVRTFVGKFVIPRTRGTGMGVSLGCNRDRPLEVTTMISHAWDENAEDFFADLEAHTREDEVLFVCFLALYQSGDRHGPSISAQLGGDIYRGPFSEVIDAVQANGGRMLVVTNGACALYDRMWCAWEAYHAISQGVPIDFTCRGQLFSSPGASTRDARCADPCDERRIRRAIEALPVPTLREHLGAAVGAWAACGAAGAAAAVLVSQWRATTVRLHQHTLPRSVAKVLALAKGSPLALKAAKVGLAGKGAKLGLGIAGSVALLMRMGAEAGGAFVERRDGYARLDGVLRAQAGERGLR